MNDLLTQDLLTIPEGAKILRVTEPRLYELCRAGVVPSIALGRQRRISRGALEDFLRSGGKSLPGGWRRAAR